MAQLFHIHPDHPQPRLIKQAAEIARAGGLVALPTDAAYSLAGVTGHAPLLDRIRSIRGVDERHHFTLMCRDLSEIASYARVSNTVYRLLKAHTPSVCTFILPATSEVPRRLMHPKKKTIGIRVPTHPVCQAILAQLGEPMLTSTLMLPGDEWPMDDPDQIALTLGKQLDVLVDSGLATTGLTTIVDLSGDEPVLVRQGMGDASGIMA